MGNQKHYQANAATQAEFDGLLRSGRVRLCDAASNTPSFDLTYNAAHALSLTALRRHSYHSENRCRAFQNPSHTLSLPAGQWRVLDQTHRKRNLAEYEDNLDIDEALLEAGDG